MSGYRGGYLDSVIELSRMYGRGSWPGFADGRDDLPCQEGDPDRWFPAPGNTRDLGRLRLKCTNSCPVFARCYEWATRYEQARWLHGVWAGTSRRQRLRINGIPGS